MSEGCVMRLLYGFVACILWCLVMFFLISEGMPCSNSMQILSLSIIIAGAMAGGD